MNEIQNCGDNAIFGGIRIAFPRIVSHTKHKKTMKNILLICGIAGLLASCGNLSNNAQQKNEAHMWGDSKITVTEEPSTATTQASSDEAPRLTGHSKYSSCHNARFGFKLRYPSFMEPDQEQSANGDGLRLHWKNQPDDIILRASGMFSGAALDNTLNDWYNEARQNYLNNGGTIVYKFFKDNRFVISGKLSNGRIYYQKSVRATLYSPLYGKNDEFDVTVYLEYVPYCQPQADEIIKYFATFPNK